MGLTLAEKNAWNPFADRAPCDLDAPTEAASGRGHFSDEPADMDQLLTATAVLVTATLVLWFSSKAVKWSVHRLFLRLSGRYGALNSEEDDGSATVFGSPLTPPPNFWLHDVDVVHPAYLTPPAEPLLFSFSPALGGAGGGGMAAQPAARQTPYASQLHTMQSAVGQAGNFLYGPGGPYCTRAVRAGMYDTPDAGNHLQFQESPNVRYRGTGGARPGSGSSPVRGWDAAVLSRQAALLPAISSVEGLMASAEFQEHIRATRRRSPFLEREQSQAKVQLYKDLRRLDPDAFQRLLSRTDIRTYDVRPPPLAFALADYMVGTVLLPLALAAIYRSEAAAASTLVRYGPLFVWLASKLRLAASGHVSLLGHVAGAYLVYDMPDDAQPGNAWEGMAGVGGHLLLAFFEVVMAALSCGVLAVGALVSISAGPRRQTLAMRLLGLRLELETTRPTRLSPFSPTCDATATVASKASSQRSPESLPGRYGVYIR